MPGRNIPLFTFQLSLWLWLCLALTGAVQAGEVNTATLGASAGEALTDADIQTMLQDWIDYDKLQVGLVVGIVDKNGVHVIAHGKADNGTDAQVNGDTLFCLGSITKVFTSLLLQDMVERGEMKLDDPVQQYLPGSYKVPAWQGKQITLLHLATHTSGLPRDGKGDREKFLAQCKLTRAPGMKWDYSNFGVGLLAKAITLKAGKDYEALVRERICRPLGMKDTCLEVTSELKTGLAVGHEVPGFRVADPGAGPGGVGGLHSTANDMLKFLAAYAGVTPTPLSSLMKKALTLHKLESGEQRPLAWFGSGPVFEHGGCIGGFLAQMAFDRDKQRGVVILANCNYCSTLLPAIWEPLIKGQSPRPRRIAPVDRTVLSRYVGLYRMETGTYHCAVRLQGERLRYQSFPRPGEPPYCGSFQIFPQSESVFHNEFFESKVEFHISETGDGVDLVFSSIQPGPDKKLLKLHRISSIAPEAPEPVVVDLKIYDSYVGQYRKSLLFGLFHIGPTLSISHRQDELGNHLFGYVREYGNGELYPKSATEFFVPSSDGLGLTFIPNKKGKTNKVIARVNGMKVTASRIADEPAM